MKIQILTLRHNEQALQIIELNKEISRLKDTLKSHKKSMDLSSGVSNGSQTPNSFVASQNLPQDFCHSKEEDCEPPYSDSDTRKISISKLDLGSFTYDDKHSTVVYNFEFYQPVDTQQIYLDIYVLEQEIKRTEPEIYLTMKEFMVGSDSKVGYMELYRFSEEIGYELFRKKVLSNRLR